MGDKMKYILYDTYGNITSVHTQPMENSIEVETDLSPSDLFLGFIVENNTLVAREEVLTNFHVLQNGIYVLDKERKLANDIMCLEAEVTPRRIREALLGDTSFIKMIEEQIAVKREELNGLRT